MTYTDEILRRMKRLGIAVEQLPELLPCAHCGDTDQIDILYSMVDGTFAISCLVDGWTTGDHAELITAIGEWNGEQLRARERRISRLLGAEIRVH